MSDPKFHAQWKSKAAFAEIAEALGVDTDHIMGMYPTAEHIIALYTPELPEDLNPMTDDPEIVEVIFHRDGDGILRETTRRLRPNMWAELRDKMERGG